MNLPVYKTGCEFPFTLYEDFMYGYGIGAINLFGNGPIFFYVSNDVVSIDVGNESDLLCIVIYDRVDIEPGYVIFPYSVKSLRFEQKKKKEKLTWVIFLIMEWVPKILFGEILY